MKIKKVDTFSFPISERAEKKVVKKLRSGVKKKVLGLFIPAEKIELREGYFPLAKFKASRPEKVKKTISSETVYEMRENYFYVNLSNADIYYIKNKGIKRYDILKKLMESSPEAIHTLGILLQFGSALAEEFNQEVLLDLATRRLISIYKLKSRELAALLIDELEADPAGRVTQTKEHVKAIYPLPKFNDERYDLSAFLQISETIVESYQKDPIKYSIERIGGILRHLFNAKITLSGVMFMPHLECDYHREDKYKTTTA